MYKIVRHFVRALIDNYAGLVRFPLTTEECQAVAAGFEANKCMPKCLGVVACTRFKIRKPQKVRSEAYRDCMGEYSFILQAIVDAEGKFLNTSCGAAGSCHDSRVYDDSVFSDMVRKKRFLQMPCKHITYLSAITPPREVEYTLTPYLIGDAAYTESLNMVVPFPGGDDALSDTQRLFNCCHSSARMAVKPAFGRLKGRWQILRQNIGVSVWELPNFVDACIILHNLCENERMSCDERDVLEAEIDEQRYCAGLRGPAGQEEEEEEEEDEPAGQEEENEEAEESAAKPDASGRSQKQALADYFMHCKAAGRLHA